MPKPYSQEFRDDVVAVARKGQAPFNQIATDFGISEGCLHNWMKKADVDPGRPVHTAHLACHLRGISIPALGSLIVRERLPQPRLTQRGIAEWTELGDITLQQGRRPDLHWTTRTALGMFQPVYGYMRPDTRISPAALPFRPHRGVHLTVSTVAEPRSAAAQDLCQFHDTVRIPQLLALPGVAGVWTFRSIEVRGPDGPLLDNGAALRITLCYLDADPVSVASDLRAAERDGAVALGGADLEGVETVLLSSPLRTIVPWKWDWFDAVSDPQS